MYSFATHFSELGKRPYTGPLNPNPRTNSSSPHPQPKSSPAAPGILNLHLATETTKPDDTTDNDNTNNMPTLTMLYKISPGPVQEAHYGLKLARPSASAALHRDGGAVAAALAAQQAAARGKRSSRAARKLASRRRLVLALREALVQAADEQQHAMDEPALASYLRRLQVEFVARMDAIDKGEDRDKEEEDAGGEGGGRFTEMNEEDGNDDME